MIKNSPRSVTVGCVAGFLLVTGVAIAVIVFCAIRQPVDLASQLPSEPVPITVVLSAPLNDHHYPINTYIPAHVTAVAGEPIETFTLELWVDGALIETKEVQPNSTGTAVAEWDWVPSAEGEHTLLARARTPQGLIGVSNLVRVTVTEQVAGNVQIPAEEGDTLESMAERYQVPVEQLQPAPWDDEAEAWSIIPPLLPPGALTDQPVPGGSPAIDPTAPLDPGQPVWVPIVYRPPSSTIQYAPPPPPSGETQPVESIDLGQVSVSWSEVFLNQSLDLIPPAAPTLAVQAGGCDVNLFITDQADNEKGFLVYRESPGGEALQRIAVLEANEGSLPLQFTDPGQQGRVTYMVAAFNAAGETPSNPASISLDQACSPEETGDLQLIGETLILPEHVDLAYFYATTNGEDWERVPPEGFFAPEGGDRVDIWEHIGTLETADIASETDLTIEAWGRTGGSLRDLGTLQTTTVSKEAPKYAKAVADALESDTMLRVCRHGKDCIGDSWVTEATDGPGGRKLLWEFYWMHEDMDSHGFVAWYASLTPFVSEDASPSGMVWPKGLVGWGKAYAEPEAGSGIVRGTFFVDLDDFRDRLPWDTPPFDLYVRIVPLVAGSPASRKASNTVVIHFEPTSPAQPTDPADAIYPEIYDVWIEEFTDEQDINPAAWGCVIAEENYYTSDFPYDAYYDQGRRFERDFSDPDCFDPAKPTCRRWLIGGGYDTSQCQTDPNLPQCIFKKTVLYSAGLPACAPKWAPPEGDSDFVALIKGTWRAVTSTWDAVVGTISWVKDKIVDGIVIALDQVGIDCSPDCQKYTRLLLDAVVAYFTGIPPELPKSEELTEMGIEYAVDLALQEIGIDCSTLDAADVPGCERALAEARDKAGEKLREAYEQAMQAPGRTPSCGVSAEAAHAFGKEPWCPPPGLKWSKMAPGAIYQPATMVVGVRRKTGIPVQTGENEDRFIRLTFEVLNLALAHTKLTLEYSGYPAVIRFDDNVEGELFESKILQIPELAEGEEILIPLVLDQSNYTLPRYVDNLRKVNSDFWLDYAPGGPKYPAAVQYSRTCLRRGGNFHVRAEVVCHDHVRDMLVPCGDEALFLDINQSPICPSFESTR
jgi:hypothetical protein